MRDNVAAKEKIPLDRSKIMARVRSLNTQPEMLVRKALHKAGLRYRLHIKGLPGTPDIVLAARRVVVDVRGCFWHQHPGCHRAKIPKTHQDYWLPKLARNVLRDEENERALRAAGWATLIIWECQTGAEDLAALIRLIKGDVN